MAFRCCPYVNVLCCIQWSNINYWQLQRYYIPTARELGRLAGIQLAPILHHFTESLSGAATIRAFDQKHRFTDSNLSLIDNHSRSWFHNVSAMEWLSFRLNQLSNFVFAFSLVLLVTLPEGIINPSKYQNIMFISKIIFAIWHIDVV